MKNVPPVATQRSAAAGPQLARVRAHYDVIAIWRRRAGIGTMMAERKPPRRWLM